MGDRAIVVTGATHVEGVRRQLDLADDRLLAEPSPRDSMAAIGLAAAILEREDPDAIIGSFAADHVIPDREAFAACIREAAEVADTGLLVTVGITPAFPSTGFGYIHAGEPLEGFPTARAVRDFVEKPDEATAEGYLAAGEHLWNAGMFVVRAAVLLDLLAENHPELAAGLRAIAADRSRLEEIWPGLTKIAIDHAVAEPAARAGRVAVVPGAFAWDDIGDFAALAGQLPGEALKVLGEADLVQAHDSSGLLVPGSGRVVAVLGMEDVVVVDTEDAVLVTTLAQAQRVRAVVDQLKAQGRQHLT